MVKFRFNLISKALIVSGLFISYAHAGGALPSPTGVVWEGQSPIKLDPTIKNSTNYRKINFFYQTENLKLINGWNGLSFDPAYTSAREWKALKAEPTSVTGASSAQRQADGDFFKSYITVGDDKYQLWQFHFHAGSEHTVGTTNPGHKSDAEVHFVHVKLHSDGTRYCIGEPGSLLVVGAFINRPLPGINAPANELNKIFTRADIPAQSGPVPTVSNVNLATILPLSSNSWRYNGSLTAPTTVATDAVNQSTTGCTTTMGNTDKYNSDAAYQLTTAADPHNGIFPEVVSWVVLQKPILLPLSQINALTYAVGDNARPVQDPKGRNVLFVPAQ